jgi:hypothetical protein
MLIAIETSFTPSPLMTVNQPEINVKSQLHHHLQVLHIMICMNMAMIFIAAGFGGIYAPIQDVVMGEVVTLV